MRPLTEDESKAVFTKLANYIGKNLIHLIDRPDELYCFRLHRDRVFYVPESSMRLGISVARPNLVSLGTCFGKFSKSVGEMPYLYMYGKRILKAHLGRITEDTPEHQGVVVYSMRDVHVPLIKLDPTVIIFFHQVYVPR
ncbi:hypothetical protein PLEOSDRAFT_53223 [Pleurotus ostreatus PC15]|uniref:Uncharacterized protein n=1 Tax=Pleurotus ostreatus (strain PC15) TaxID=1137138 RepID=A0A067NFF1_PLEO1|nr:hypothetical protein PLEOSDRAFT_53223 [Pleurotus ostreatus PC15]